MIAVGETIDRKRTVIFHLASGSTAVPLHSWSTGELKYCLPGGSSYANANVSRITEIGNGDYAYALEDALVQSAGVVSLRIAASGADAQNYVVGVGPSILSHETADSRREVVFELALGGAEVTGHSWASGEIQIATPGSASYVNADQTRVVERGYGVYAYPLTDAQCANAGTGSLYLAASGADASTVAYEISDLGDLVTLRMVVTSASTTTPTAICNRARDVMKGLAPTSATETKFVEYKNELDGDFLTWAQKNPAACLRVFQIRTDGSDRVPEISNMDVEERWTTLVVRVAYPQTNRFTDALGRDKVMDEDAHQIEAALGMNGRANFSSAAGYPDACWREGGVEPRLELDGVDIVEMRFSYSYQRAV